MTSRHPHRRWPAGARALAGPRRYLLAVGSLIALVALAVPMQANAADGLTRVTQALTGLNDVSHLTAQSVCLPATPTRSHRSR